MLGKNFEENEPTDYDYFKNKRTDKVYMSKRILIEGIESTKEGVVEKERPVRYVSKVLENEQQEFVKIKDEIVLRVTPNARQEIVAKILEDTRNILMLQIQRFTTQTGAPHRTYFTFVGKEIAKLYFFIRNIALLPIEGEGKQQFTDDYLENIILSKQNILKFINDQPELIPELLEELQKHDIKSDDIRGLAYRKEQLEIFRQMLESDEYFEKRKQEKLITKNEAVWQNFFEENSWILGYGLNYVFNSELDDSKLEQVVKGYDFNNSGKRVDLFMKTRGIINSLCFGEIKTHKTSLLKDTTPYRKGSWMVSNELAGGVAQIQKTVQKAIESIKTKTEIKDEFGSLTGEQLYLYSPKSFLLIGSLQEFMEENGINEDKFSSFELFRRNIINPEIITFDELYERAKNIVNNPQVVIS
ncbi:MAG: hypothetical protein BWX62_00451 [Bacteroidetes bacterium ADurb.Bin037]|nr:MAG: hypothetical protein BWX62_00451 [Bacteroidetes bacterium ADurb.Bin037]HPW78448.1 DUF4263 domain-containing protein [Bacteroidales bacterium]HQB55924.1 DUF4263 domain-containing protein [Bacteroidales bacterium]